MLMLAPRIETTLKITWEKTPGLNEGGTKETRRLRKRLEVPVEVIVFDPSMREEMIDDQ